MKKAFIKRFSNDPIEQPYNNSKYIHWKYNEIYIDWQDILKIQHHLKFRERQMNAHIIENSKGKMAGPITIKQIKISSTSNK